MTNLEKLEAEREATYSEYIKAIGTSREAALLAKLDEIDAVLDGEEEEEETLNTSTNWDEWMIDHAIDRARDERAAMAYEV